MIECDIPKPVKFEIIEELRWDETTGGIDFNSASQDFRDVLRRCGLSQAELEGNHKKPDDSDKGRHLANGK